MLLTDFANTITWCPNNAGYSNQKIRFCQLGQNYEVVRGY